VSLLERLPEAAVPARPLRVRVAWGEEAIALLDERWDALVRRQPVPNPTLSATWLREMMAWERGVPFVVVVETGDRLVGGGAFGLRRPLGPRGPRLATWLGGGRRMPDLLVDPEVPDAGERLVDALVREAHAVSLLSTPLDGAAASALGARTPWVGRWHEVDGWVVALPPPKLEDLRAKVAYAKRRAARLGARVSVSVAGDPEAVAAGLERLFTLHRERWRGRRDKMVQFSTTEEQRAWHRRAVAAMAAHGEVRLVEVFEDDEPVAASLDLVAGRSTFLLTTATRVGGRLRSPGYVTILACVEAAMAAGGEVMNLGGGSGEPGTPKAALGPTLVPCGRLIAARLAAAQRALEGALWLRKAVWVARMRLGWRRAEAPVSLQAGAADQPPAEEGP
jgi:CelD/BcsL family acetyltransferase involved in cellulose biosynthesis